MKETETSNTIIIFDNFSVYSPYSKEITLSWLRQSSLICPICYSHLPPSPSNSICPDKRVLLHLHTETTIATTLSIQSSTHLEDTIEILKTASRLLEANEANFFLVDKENF